MYVTCKRGSLFEDVEKKVEDSSQEQEEKTEG